MRRHLRHRRTIRCSGRSYLVVAEPDQGLAATQPALHPTSHLRGSAAPVGRG